MAFVITDNCIKDGLCVDACPNDSIHPRTDEGGFEAATQMYVNPAECLDCGACVPACTSDAIFSMDDVTSDNKHAIAAKGAYLALDLRMACPAGGGAPPA